MEIFIFKENVMAVDTCPLPRWLRDCWSSPERPSLYCTLPEPRLEHSRSPMTRPPPGSSSGRHPPSTWEVLRSLPGRSPSPGPRHRSCRGRSAMVGRECPRCTGSLWGSTDPPRAARLYWGRSCTDDPSPWQGPAQVWVWRVWVTDLTSRCSYSCVGEGRQTGLILSLNFTDGMRTRATSNLLDLRQNIDNIGKCFTRNENIKDRLGGFQAATWKYFYRSNSQNFIHEDTYF